MSIDTFLGDVHEDRKESIEEKMRAIERDLAQRHVLSVMTTNTLFDQLRKVREDILLLFPEHAGAPDLHRRDRQALELEQRRIEQAIEAEQREDWRDAQELHRERRELVREHREETQRYHRLSGAYE
jgi:hypothetical protein